MTDIPDDAPLRLKDAVKIAFPAGGMTVSGLRGEITRGRLEAEMIAGKHFVTLRAIREMRERCKVVPQPYVKLPPRYDFSPPKKRTPGVIYASDIPEDIMRDAAINHTRKLIEKSKREEREQKRREGGRVLRRD